MSLSDTIICRAMRYEFNKSGLLKNSSEQVHELFVFQNVFQTKEHPMILNGIENFASNK